jgi:hypothetical protein
LLLKVIPIFSVSIGNLKDYATHSVATGRFFLAGQAAGYLPGKEDIPWHT